MPKQMNEQDVNYVTRSISLPIEAWGEVDAQANDWGTSGRSATVHRIIKEWQALRQALAAQNGKGSDSKIIIIAA